MASSKPQSYYICLLKALRETSSQSQSLGEACTKVTKLIPLCPGLQLSLMELKVLS